MIYPVEIARDLSAFRAVRVRHPALIGRVVKNLNRFEKA